MHTLSQSGASTGSSSISRLRQCIAAFDNIFGGTALTLLLIWNSDRPIDGPKRMEVVHGGTRMAAAHTAMCADDIPYGRVAARMPCNGGTLVDTAEMQVWPLSLARGCTAWTRSTLTRSCCFEAFTMMTEFIDSRSSNWYNTKTLQPSYKTLPLRDGLQKEISDNLEYGEAVLALLKRKAENQLELIAPAHDEQVVEFWRALLDIQTVQNKLVHERYRLSVLHD
jgi:hypothetical protein